jgi:NAD(P)H-flavin reductase
MNRSKSNGDPSPWKSHTVRVQHVVQESPGVATYTVVFTDPELEKTYRFLPGQFNMLYMPGVGESAISISSDPKSPEVLRHTIRSVGGVTQAIAAAGCGTTMGLRGPFGSSWPIDECLNSPKDPREVILVAGGIGMAPLRSAIYALCENRSQVAKITLLVGARCPQDLLFAEEYSQWEERGLDVQTTVDRPAEGWQGHIGVVTTLLNRLMISRPENALLMTCGPEVMMRYVVQSSLQRGLLPENLWLSLERNMNCAVGMCGHCQLGPEFLCKDGPVLPYTKVSNWLKVQAF